MGHSSHPKNDSNMQLSPQEKIKECIENAKAYFKKENPDIIVEYNFPQVEEEWFMGFDFRFEEKCEKNTAKYVYKM